MRRWQAFVGAVTAEWRVLVRRPVPWVVLGGLIMVVVVPAYVGRWAGMRSAIGIPGVEAVAASLAPVHAPALAAQAIPEQGGLFAFALGALLVGRDHVWGTAQARAFHGGSRSRTALARTATLALVVAGAAMASVLTAVAIAAIAPHPGLGAPTGPPAPADLAGAAAIIWLILMCWAAAGLLLATLWRSATAALAVGATYLLTVEQALRGTAGHIEVAADIRRVLLVGLGRAAGALLESPRPPSRPMHPPLAVAVLAGLTAAMTAIAIMLADRKDA